MLGEDAAAEAVAGYAATARVPTRAVGADLLSDTGQVWRQMARAGKVKGEAVTSAGPERLARDSFLGQRTGAENRMAIQLNAGQLIRLSVQGAGHWPATTAVAMCRRWCGRWRPRVSLRHFASGWRGTTIARRFKRGGTSMGDAESRPDVLSLLEAFVIGTQNVTLGARVMEINSLPRDCQALVRAAVAADLTWGAWSTARGVMVAWGEYDAAGSARLRAHHLRIEWFAELSGHHEAWCYAYANRPLEWTFGRGEPTRQR